MGARPGPQRQRRGATNSAIIESIQAGPRYCFGALFTISGSGKTDDGRPAPPSFLSDAFRLWADLWVRKLNAEKVMIFQHDLADSGSASVQIATRGQRLRSRPRAAKRWCIRRLKNSKHYKSLKGTKVFGQMVDPRPHEWRQPCPRRKYEMNNTLLAIPVRKDAHQRAGT
jgi:hypothetical protein